MKDNFKNPMKNDQGFTLLEMIVVIIVVSIIGFVALSYYQKLMVDVERTKIQHDVGVMRSAIGIQVAKYIVAGEKRKLGELVGSNPMDLLDERPENYRGAYPGVALNDLDTGFWYFDSSVGILYYVVRNGRYCQTVLDNPKRLEFKISPILVDKGVPGEKSIEGLTLRESEPYRWLSPWD